MTQNEVNGQLDAKVGDFKNEGEVKKEKREPSLAYRGDIDGLRAISITLVVIVHSIHIHDNSRTVGVDIFFVISGYLITTILLKQNTKGTFSISKFYARRVKRILPILFISIAAYLIITMIFHADNLKQTGEHAIWSLFMSFNLLMVKYRLHPHHHPTVKHYYIFTPHWSLGIEEQFYIVWPLVLAWALRNKKQNLYRNVGITALISFSLMIAFNLAGEVIITNFFPFCRYWELFAGCMLALTEFKQVDQEKARLNITLNDKIEVNTTLDDMGGNFEETKISLEITSKSCAENNNQIRFNFTEFLYCLINLGIIGTALVDNNEACEKVFYALWTIFIIKNKNTYFNKYILGNKIMTFIGKASYSIYLWHMGIITLIHYDTPWVAVGVGLFGIAMYPLESMIRQASHSFVIPGIAIFGIILLTCCIATQF